MSSAILIVLKVVFLAAIWLFIAFVANVVRTDLRISDSEQPSPKIKKSKTKGKTNTPSHIYVITGKAEGLCAPLPRGDEEIVIGRSANCDLDIADDYASSTHARIWVDEESYVVEDLQSTNGTYVNGYKIDQPTRIGSEDIVRIGRSQLQLGV